MTKQPRFGVTSSSALFVGVPGRGSKAMAIKHAAALPGLPSPTWLRAGSNGE